jgi:predicted nuclease of restriction endonuclease-like (RecB) superfamily
MKALTKLEGYNEILKDIHSLLEKTKYQAYKAVDNIRVQTYWQIGERIARSELEHKDRADYGKRIIERLTIDLGFQKRDLYRMVQFYKTYPIVTSLMSQLSWTHYTVLVMVEHKEERQFYEVQTIQNSWSSRRLRQEIKNNLYQRVLKKGKAIVTTAILLKPALPDQVFKNTYNFDFLQLQKGYTEKQLEDAILSNAEKVLLEFGSDFSLAGRQKKIVIDNLIHTVDLEFYHRGIPCVVIVDLKIGKFKAEYIGQMNKYLNYYRENRKYKWEKNPIGLIICEYKGKEEVHYALGGLENKIFIAEYKTKLPSEKEIAKRLRKIRKGG